MKGLVLAGGYGTRLRPLTFTGNKHMIPIANQPILFYGLKHLAQGGIRDVAIVLGPLHEGIRESVGDGRAFGLRVEYVIQGEPKGLAHAVSCARKFLGDEPFLMYLGDNLLQSGVDPFTRQFAADQPDAVVGTTPVSQPQNYGVVEIADGEIVTIEEKPVNPRSNLALIGVYLFTPAIHPIIDKLSPSQRGELEITDAIWRLWKSRGRVSVVSVDGWWKDTGKPSDLLEANELVLRTSPVDTFRVESAVPPGVVIEGPVGVGPGSLVESGARLVGPTLLGANVRVDGGSTIGPYSAVGNGVTLKRATLRRSIVLDHARIEGVTLSDSLVGRNVEVVSGRPASPEATVMLGDSARVHL